MEGRELPGSDLGKVWVGYLECQVEYLICRIQQVCGFQILVREPPQEDCIMYGVLFPWECRNEEGVEEASDHKEDVCDVCRTQPGRNDGGVGGADLPAWFLWSNGWYNNHHQLSVEEKGRGLEIVRLQESRGELEWVVGSIGDSTVRDEVNHDTNFGQKLQLIYTIPTQSCHTQVTVEIS
jgi:hypothetical protein